jgi:RHS repeat-associated protein
MKQFQNNWENYLEIVEIPENMAVGAVSYALETAKGDRGNKVFELSNHLGNVLATVSDKKLGRVLDSTSFVAAYYDAQVRSVQDYYAFGWTIPSRKFNTGSYRHGFNGKENDSDFGEQLIQDYGFRIYNPSVGRFLSVDPLAPDYPELTIYQFASNSPISGIDLDGLEYVYASDGEFLGKFGDSPKVRVVDKEYTQTVKFMASHQGQFPEAEAAVLTGAFGYDVDIANEELNTRVTLTVIRIAEHGNKPDKSPLDYNRRYGRTNGEPNTFSDYSKHPNIAFKGAGYNITSTAAGAYQFLYDSWETIASLEDLEDFSPESQDKGALNLIRRQEQYNPRANGVLDNIRKGEVLEALDKLHGTWTSLPGGRQEKMTAEEAPKIINDVRAKELKGESVIATEDLDDL